MPSPAAQDQDTHIQADDVASSVAAAIDKLEAEDAPPAAEAAPDEQDLAAAAEQTDIVPHETTGDEPPGDAASEITDPDPQTDTDTSLQGQEETGQTETQVDYPEHWDQSHKEDFEKLPGNMQNFLLERHKSMEADYTRKNMETADLRREYEPVDQMMRAFAPVMQQQGIGPGGLIKRWAQAESYLNSQPKEAIKNLANYYGVDLAALAYDSPAQQQGTENSQQGYVDPQVQSLQSQVNNLQTQTHLQTINAFADDVDVSGNKTHPYFDEVAPVIAKDMQAAQMLGLQPSLEDLYEQACWKTTSVREKLMKAQQPQPDNQAAALAKAEEARKRAARAKTAGRSISGDAGSAAEPPPEYKTTEEAVAAAYDKHTH